MTVIEFSYDFGSPNAYLVHKVLPGIAAKCRAKLVWQPVLLGGVFKATNNQSPMTAFASVSGKLAYQNHEIERFIARYDIPYARNPHFPVNTIAMMRGAIFAHGKPWQAAYTDAMFNAMWRFGERMDDPDVMARVLTAAGLPVAKIMAAAQTPEVKAALIEATTRAVERGVFGVPTMLVGTEMYFGKDSLNDLEYDLARQT